ncbi:MAG: sugar ABC transporter ATP-binding protein, partial [Anaerolineaceae bacterium]|nr:sugar ABC transporter ATP-binding protein [Anaerolineaceae bacterium]
MEEVLRVENISKSFPGVLAVDNVSFSARKGEVLALLGENGAGKSTLMQILGGVHRPERGQIFLEERPVSFTSPEDAMHAGVSMVFQELSLVGSLSVAENIFANRQPAGPLGIIRWNSLYRQTQEFLDRFDLSLDPRRPVKHLSMGQQQILEILKAISTHPRLLILDEPTSSLTEAETAHLFHNILRLRAQGMSFIYITHKLSEVFQIADRVMVMRDGQFIDLRPVDQVCENDLIAMMVGRQITNLYGAARQDAGEEYFRVAGLSRRGAFEDISFSLHRGEVLGLAGLVGAGRTEVSRAIFGIDPRDSGRIFLNGRELTLRDPHAAIRAGIAYLTEDRKGEGLFLNLSIQDNLVAPSLDKFTLPGGVLSSARMHQFGAEQVERYAIVTSSTGKQVLKLSGGNQ